LLFSIIIGGVAGVVFGSKATIVKPFGDLFLNLMFTIIVPLVFFSIASAIANMSGMKRLGKIMGGIFLVFVITALISAILGYIGAVIVDPLKNTDVSSIKSIMSDPGTDSNARGCYFPGTTCEDLYRFGFFRVIFEK
jgi:Na+/H+-dicarboxylate symporter